MEPGPALIVDGDASALQRLFVNLVDNAVKYGDRGAHPICRPTRRARWWRSPTTDPACRRSSAIGCSSPSIASRARATATPAASALASPSPAPSPARTAATSALERAEPGQGLEGGGAASGRKNRPLVAARAILTKSNGHRARLNEQHIDRIFLETSMTSTSLRSGLVALTFALLAAPGLRPDAPARQRRRMAWPGRPTYARDDAEASRAEWRRTTCTPS